MKKQKPLI